MAALTAGLLQAMTAGPCVAQATATATAPSAADTAVALDLATMIAPSTLMVETEVRAFRQGFEGGLAADADSQALLKAHPDLPGALWAKIEPEVRRSAQANLGPYRAMISDLFLARLSRAEMESLRVFYGTVTGQKLIRGMYGNLDASGLVGDMVRSGDSKVAPEAAIKVINAAKAKTLNAIDESDRPALMQLARSMSMNKLQTVGAEIQSASIAWGNKPDPELDARLQQLIAAEMKVRTAPGKPKG